MRKLYSSKRAADPNQMFIYISAIVIVAFIFLYGFKSVLGFLKSSQEIELVKFIKDFKAKASSVSTDFGSVQYLTINIPSQFEKMCIVKLDDSYPAFFDTDECINSGLNEEICDSWFEYKADSTLEKKNIFFVDAKNHVGYKDLIDDIQVDVNVDGQRDGYLCTNEGRLRLEGGARVATVTVDTSQ